MSILERLDRARRAVAVIGSSLVTWLALTATMVGTIADEVGELVPEADWIVAGGARLAVVLLGAAAVIRRVTRVPEGLEGITGPAVEVRPAGPQPTGFTLTGAGNAELTGDGAD